MIVFKEERKKGFFPLLNRDFRQKRGNFLGFSEKCVLWSNDLNYLLKTIIELKNRIIEVILPFQKLKRLKCDHLQAIFWKVKIGESLRDCLCREYFWHGSLP